MSEVVITAWKHKDGPKPDGTMWHAIFFAIDGNDKPVPWFYDPNDPEAEAAIEFLEGHEPPVTMETGFKESKRGLTMDTWEIIDAGGEHVGTSVVAGKGVDERPHSPPESEAAIGPSPAAPPKATTPTPNELELEKEVRRLREEELKKELKRTHPSLNTGNETPSGGGEHRGGHTPSGKDNELATIDTVSLPITPDQALQQWKDYIDLTRKLLGADDYQRIGNRDFKKKSAWRKYAKAFNIDDRILGRELFRDRDGRVVEAEFTVEAVAPNGRRAVGVGACSIADKAHAGDLLWPDKNLRCKGPCDGRPHYSHPDHDIRATAHTRAKNRAISDLIGAGEVSAEEME